MRIFLTVSYLLLFWNDVSAQFAAKTDRIMGIRVGGYFTKYKFDQFPLQPPVVVGTGYFNTFGSISPSLQPNMAISFFYKKPISSNNWLDFEVGLRTRGYKSFYALVDNQLVSQPYQNRFLSIFTTASLQLNLTQLWYLKPGVRIDALVKNYTNPNYDYWVSRYSTLEFSPVIATGIILPSVNIEFEINPGLMNLVKFPATYMAAKSQLKTFTIGLSVAYKLKEY